MTSTASTFSYGEAKSVCIPGCLCVCLVVLVPRHCLYQLIASMMELSSDCMLCL
jgi:hypothetical protein